MKLSELVKIRRSLQNVFPSEYEQPVNQRLTALSEIFCDNGLATQSTIKDLKISQEKINDSFAEIRKIFNDYKNYIEACILASEKEYLDISEQIYKDSVNDNAKYILTRRKQSLTLSHEDNRDLFLSRLGMYNSWQYPAIEIRPAFGEITEVIKGCDPLYLLDTSDDLFAETRKKWNKIYQRRLRYYTFDEENPNMLAELPDEQFGLVVSVDYFNFKPLYIIENFLKEIYTKLRPGGVLVFTYNNCDLPYAVKNVENRFCCYTPGRTVKEMALNTGYEIIKSFDQLENISWLELCKPGEIKTIRGGQTLGEIRSFN